MGQKYYLLWPLPLVHPPFLSNWPTILLKRAHYSNTKWIYNKTRNVQTRILAQGACCQTSVICFKLKQFSSIENKKKDTSPHKSLAYWNLEEDLHSNIYYGSVKYVWEILLFGNTSLSTLIICKLKMQYILYYITCEEHELVCDYFTQLMKEKPALNISGFPKHKPTR